jgi:hypothetical protein
MGYGYKWEHSCLRLVWRHCRTKRGCNVPILGGGGEWFMDTNGNILVYAWFGGLAEPNVDIMFPFWAAAGTGLWVEMGTLLFTRGLAALQNQTWM